ncbi:hypothetical protein [Burkholderia vietnamiensis]|uniref:hypothetical protein n=1 Tax=Burkholderia vietnamiensis TaxID=60552 RepID=UPI001CAC38A4|nr:hypothetical protein BVI434_420059 [Burkholderia vietnamiensis]
MGYLYDVEQVRASGPLCFHTHCGPLHAYDAAALSPRLLAAPGATIDHFARAVDDFLVLLIRRKRQAGSRPTSTR